MGRRRRHRAALILSIVLTTVAIIDAGRGSTWDTAVVLGAALVLQLGLLAAGNRTRRDVAVRADLHAWAAQRAAETGEDLDHVADRCLAAYRAGLVSDEDAPRPVLTAPRHGRHANGGVPQPATPVDRVRP